MGPRASSKTSVEEMTAASLCNSFLSFPPCSKKGRQIIHRCISTMQTVGPHLQPEFLKRSAWLYLKATTDLKGSTSKSQFTEHWSENSKHLQKKFNFQSSYYLPKPPSTAGYALPDPLHLHLFQQILTPVKFLIWIPYLCWPPYWGYLVCWRRGIPFAGGAVFGVSIQSSKPWEGPLSLLRGGPAGLCWQGVQLPLASLDNHVR